MIIRKLFEFENAHIVRFCSSSRCKSSIHGQHYLVLENALFYFMAYY